TVSGSAEGDIIYRFDCRNDGSWEKTETTSSTSFTAYDLCDYSINGNYTAMVQVEREGLTKEETVDISVSDAPTLSVVLLAENPSSGTAPLNDVDLKASVSGSADGLITYKFYCNSTDTTAAKTVTTTTNPYTAQNLCDYGSSGTKTAKVTVDRQGLSATDTVSILVSEPETLSITSATASPNSGDDSLSGIVFTVNATGTLIDNNPTIRVDCTDDGIYDWHKGVDHLDDDFDNGAQLPPYVTPALCSYPNPGSYTARVKLEHALLPTPTTKPVTITVNEPETLSITSATASPNSGDDSLSGIVFTVNATGTLIDNNPTIRVDCTDDGIYDWHKGVDHLDDDFDNGAQLPPYVTPALCSYPNPGSYTARVKLEHALLPTPTTKPVTITVNELQPPTAPSNLTGIASLSSQINLLWDDNSDNESEFFLYRKRMSNWDQYKDWHLVANTESRQDTGLTMGTTYYYQLDARNAAGDSSNATVLATTQVPFHYVSSTGKTSIFLSWYDAPDADFYQLKRWRLTNMEYETYYNIEDGTLTFENQGLDCGTTYFYQLRVWSIYSDNKSSWAEKIISTSACD
ncbi:hypothetical protein ACFL06_01985, partial [Patescibacteria group bacterium]